MIVIFITEKEAIMNISLSGNIPEYVKSKGYTGILIDIFTGSG